MRIIRRDKNTRCECQGKIESFIIRITYLDTDHILMQDVNGVRETVVLLVTPVFFSARMSENVCCEKRTIVVMEILGLLVSSTDSHRIESLYCRAIHLMKFSLRNNLVS